MPTQINVLLNDAAIEKLDVLQQIIGRHRADAVEQAILSVDTQQCAIDYHDRCRAEIQAAAHEDGRDD